MEQSVLTVPYSENAYIESAIPAPERDGYAFAGWQTRPVVTEADLVNGVSPYIWMFGTQSNYGYPADAMYIKDIENLTADGVATLYARWVEVKDIASAEKLQAIGNDLYGAYRLVEDIQLMDDWKSIGYYFTNYELYSTDWWTYAFRGSLDGNGHTVTGLTIKGAAVDIDGYADNAAVWHNDGDKADGCAAMFGAIAGADIHDLTLDTPVVDISGDFAVHGDYIYAAPLASFDMGSTISNGL